MATINGTCLGVLHIPQAAQSGSRMYVEWTPTYNSTAGTTKVTANIYIYTPSAINTTYAFTYLAIDSTSSTVVQGGTKYSSNVATNNPIDHLTTQRYQLNVAKGTHKVATVSKTFNTLDVTSFTITAAYADLSGVGPGASHIGSSLNNPVVTTSFDAYVYTIAYNANGGTGAPANQTKDPGVDITLSSATPTRAGYTFEGWATSSTGSVVYQPGSVYSTDASVTLYAVWREHILNITYNANGGQIVGSPSYDINTLVQALGYDSDHNLYDIEAFGIVREGYTYPYRAEWNSRPDGTGVGIDQEKLYWTGKTLSEALGLDLASGDVSATLYVNWTIDLSNGPLTGSILINGSLKQVRFFARNKTTMNFKQNAAIWCRNSESEEWKQNS